MNKRVTFCVLVLAALLGGLFSTNSLQAQDCSVSCVIVILPTADTFIDEFSRASKNAVRGGLWFVEVGNFNLGDDKYKGQTLLRYDLSPLAQYGAFEIVSAEMRASHFSSFLTNAVTSINLHRLLNDTWTETGATWNNTMPLSLSPAYGPSLTVPYYRNNNTPVGRSWSIDADLIRDMWEAGPTGTIVMQVASSSGVKFCSLQVGGICGGSAPSLSITIQTNHPPTAAMPISPTDGQRQIPLSPTLEWTPSIDPDGDAVTYSVRINMGQGQSLTYGGLAQTHIDLPRLSPGTHYQWSVTSTDTRGLATVSAMWTFMTTEFIAPASLSAIPMQGAVELTWQDLSDESRFEIESRAPGGPWNKLANVGPNYTLYMHTGLACDAPARDYRVRGYRASDDLYSNYSNVASAAPLECLPTKTLLKMPPDHEEVSKNPQFIWTHDSHYTTYTLSIVSKTNPSIALALPVSAAESCSRGICVYDFATRGQLLPQTDSYQWRIIVPGDNAALNSESRSLTVRGGAPWLNSPESGTVIGEAAAQFTWTGDGFSEYEWYVKAQGHDLIRRLYAASAICINNQCRVDTRALPNNETITLPEGPLVWGVIGRMAGQEQVRYASGENTLIAALLPPLCRISNQPSCLRLISPIDEYTGTNTNTPFTWTEDRLHRATHYTLTVTDDTGRILNTNQVPYTFTPGDITCTQGVCRINLPFDLVTYPGDGSYHWRLELELRRDNAPTLRISDTLKFSINFTPPVPDLIAPLNGVIINPAVDMLRWQFNKDWKVGAYEIEIYDGSTRINQRERFIYVFNDQQRSGKTVSCKDDCAVAIRDVTLNNGMCFAANRTYRWRVLQYNSLGLDLPASEWANFRSLITLCSVAMGAPTETPTSTASPTLTEALTETPTVTATETPTDAATATDTATPTETPTDITTPTETPLETPIVTEEPSPTELPTSIPQPTEEPASIPTERPTDVPTELPADAPTDPPAPSLTEAP